MIKNKVHQSDNLEFCRKLDDDIIDLIVTSPPYDDVRDYNSYEWDFTYLSAELYRVLKPGGVLVWQVNDKVIDGNQTGTSFRQALAFQSLGFKWPLTIIYRRPVRPLKPPYIHRVFEYMFVFSKGRIKTFNEDEVKDRKNKGYGITRTANAPRNVDGSMGKRSQRKEVQEFGLREDIWDYNTGHGHSARDKIAHKHPAIFPEKVAEDHIKVWTNPGDLVFDPFAGSFTTAVVAERLSREWLACELSEEYCKIGQERLDNERKQVKLV